LRKHLEEAFKRKAAKAAQSGTYDYHNCDSENCQDECPETALL
jgi:hypothetical protein